MELADSIDLHHFRPREIADLVEEYVRAANDAGFATVRIIHGKGTGTQKRIVESVLARHPLVARFYGDGNWGATIVDLRAVALACTRTPGAQPPVVLLHGLLGSGACWAPLARALAHEVAMPDLRGHGHSPAGAGYTYDDHAADVLRLVAGMPPPVLLGHSMGGMIAAVVAGRTEVRGLVLVDPTFLSPARQREVHASDVAAQHREMVRRSREELVADGRARHPHRALEIVELQAAARLQTRPEAFAVLEPPNPPYRDVVAAIAAPTLLVHGDTGAVVTPEMAAELRASNPRVASVQIANAGHGLPFDQPDRLAEVVAAFLRDLA